MHSMVTTALFRNYGITDMGNTICPTTYWWEHKNMCVYTFQIGTILEFGPFQPPFI
jgi:hypothetical protein